MRLASLTSALILVGCASQGDEGMIVLNNTAVAGSSCMLTGDATQPFVSHGQIYAGATRGYTLTPLIQSRVTIGMTEGAQDLLQKTISLRGADVQLTVKATEILENGVYTTSSTERALPGFSVLFSGSLPPSGTVNVGFEVLTAAQIQNIVVTSGAAPSATLRAEVLAEVTIHGDLGGDDVEASPFFFPISVCTDCVVNNLGTCPILTTPRTGNACNPFQDGVLDCCTSGTELICPATM